MYTNGEFLWLPSEQMLRKSSNVWSVLFLIINSENEIAMSDKSSISPPDKIID